jgi:hypothetical protein
VLRDCPLRAGNVESGRMPFPDPARRPAFYGIWYLLISAGFCLLAVRGMLRGHRRRLTVFRWIISAGFLLLALLFLLPLWRARRARGREAGRDS